MRSIMFKLDDLFRIMKGWRNLKDISVSQSTFETVEIIQALRQTRFMNQIQNLTLHLASDDNSRNVEYTNNVDKAIMEAVILAASKLQSFKLSRFKGHLFLGSVARFLENITLEKLNFDELSETGSTLAKNLKIKL
ncbi:hypothetical protein Fcan01_21836 [Folsomia candida]|uniref:Uncharacterized protein n=1 Tax=Folsomia candida TaxID=158441 RepID=A0A226DEH0_FOLCA|nr:hypothetical protein Fcan01_21836 [Folsomia candida]